MINTTKDLTAFCKRLSKCNFITVDTEFIRERTYWPELCLIQVASPSEAECIDPLADGIDLTPLFKLMQNKKVLKVFHSARQDIEIFYSLMGSVPVPLFDTQIGAMVCGFGESVSYQALVLKFLKINLDKSSRFTDWSRRPLTEQQATYALSDVTHLVRVYELMRDMLHQKERTSWVSDEMAHLIDDELYNVDPYKMWQKLKRTSNNPKFLSVLREVTAWREIEAQRTNHPRRFMLKDEALLEIAASMPKTTEELSKLRTISKGVANGPMGVQIIDAIKKGLSLTPAEHPTVEKPKVITPAIRSTADMLRVVLNLVAGDQDVAARVIASSEDLEDIAMSDTAAVPALSGWRYDIFGQKALAFKHGQLAIAFNPKSKKIEFMAK